jgi:transcription elongation factor GreA
LIVDAIEEARAHGDLSENAEYHAAKERQGQVEATIADLEDKLSRAQVIDPTMLSGDKIVFGATVTLPTRTTSRCVPDRRPGRGRCQGWQDQL